MKSLFRLNENHTSDAAYLAGLEANGVPDGTVGNEELVSVKLLVAESKEKMKKGELEKFNLVFPQTDARKIAAQILAAAEGDPFGERQSN
jgi:hypothetical protein